MRCCKKELKNPDIIEGSAYFVCAECGNVREVKNYRVYTTQEAFTYFEQKYGLALPEEYAKYSGISESLVVKLPASKVTSLKYYFGEGFYEIGRFASVDPNEENSIYEAVASGKEWGLNDKLIPLEGDGHTWLALDYSESHNEPKVVVVEADEGNSLIVASCFKEFVESLLKYEEVYNLDGDIVYGKKNT